MAMLEVRDLEVYYGVIQAIKGISFDVNQGEIVALIGANGAGKTTTMKIMAGLLKADAGEIYIDDIKLFEDYNRLKEVIGYMPDFLCIVISINASSFLLILSIEN